MLEDAMPRAGSRMDFPIAMAILRKNWSFPPMNSNALAAEAQSAAARAIAGANALTSREEQATLRWCISSPIARPRAMMGFSAMGKARKPLPRSGPNSSRNQARRASTSASLPPKRITLPKPSLRAHSARLPKARFWTTSSGMLAVVIPVIGPTAPKW
jgi:hypothetical protein